MTALAPGQIEATVQERLREGSDEYELLARPPQMRSQVEDLGHEVRITIPGPRFTLAMLAQLVIPIGIVMYFVPSPLAFFSQADMPKDMKVAYIIFSSFILIGFVLVPLIRFAFSAIDTSKRYTRVTVTPRELVVEERDARRTRTTRVPAGAIQSLDYNSEQAALEAARRLAEQRSSQPGSPGPLPPGGEVVTPGWLTALSKLVRVRGVAVRSRDGLTTFGAGLPDAEVAYLRALVKRTLAG